MAGFTEGALEKKLADLNSSAQSIQTLSLWLIHHRKHYSTIVNVWYKELVKAKMPRKLTFMYLANDVIQNSKKKGPEFGSEFGSALKKVFEHIGTLETDEKTNKGLNRLLQIWEERLVYDMKQIKEFRASWDQEKSPEPTLPKKQKKDKKEKKEERLKEKNKGWERVRERQKSETEVEVEIDGKTEVHVTLSPKIPAADPPEPDELIKALQDLENSASSDAVIREKIAKLPPEVSEVSLLSKVEDKAAAETLLKQVSDAVQLLLEYNNRLSAELDDRKNGARMLQDFIQAQKDLLSQAEDRLEEYREKLNKVYQVRSELRSHIQSLPDLTKLPDVTGGLAPLPSAGDLFSIR